MDKNKNKTILIGSIITFKNKKKRLLEKNFILLRCILLKLFVLKVNVNYNYYIFFFLPKCKRDIIKKAKKIKVHPIGIQHPNH